MPESDCRHHNGRRLVAALGSGNRSQICGICRSEGETGTWEWEMKFLSSASTIGDSLGIRMTRSFERSEKLLSQSAAVLAAVFSFALGANSVMAGQASS